MSSNSVSPAASSKPLPHRLAFDTIIGAIYRIAFSRRPADDIFAGAVVRWSDFILPIALQIAINIAYELVSDAHTRMLLQTGAQTPLILLGLIAAGLLLRMIVALFVTYGVGGGLSTPDRVWPGLLAFAWMQAALVSPWIILMRTTIEPRGPLMWLSVALVVGMLVGMIGCAGKVMRVAFALPGLAQGIFVALAGNIVSYFVDWAVWSLI